MKEESEVLSAQQSLDIITSMIQDAKGNVRENSFYFLFWGWITVMANFGVYILTQFNYKDPHVVWLITIPAWIFTLYKGFKNRNSKGTITHLDMISKWLWIWFGICVFTLMVFGSKINYQLNPLIIMISSIPTFVSGTIIRFKPLVFGGIALWVFGIVSFLVPADIQSLIGGVAVICGYLIPGYLLKNKKSGLDV